MRNILCCFEALERLKSKQCINIPNNSKINLDTVATEAGLYRGFIRRSNGRFKLLIDAIEQAATLTKDSTTTYTSEKVRKLKSEKNHYKKLYEDSVAREVSLMARINALESLLGNYNGSNIVDIHRRKL